MLNIKIHIFTYGIGGDEKRWSWKTVCPDQEMSQYSDFPAGAVPDMYLYNSDNCHFDLLVADNSRLAVLGLISMEGADNKIKEKERGTGNFQWTKVKSSKKGNKSFDDVSNTEITPDSDEIVITKHKQSGHRREGPQAAPIVKLSETVNVDIETHMESLKVSKIQRDICQEDFVKKSELDTHMKIKHSKQWNCEQCDFQASTRAILPNHCKLTQGQQPSRQKQRLGQTGVLECYTCRSEFRSYHDLMNHRKEEHPSHKVCRYFLKGMCNFNSEECWYLHEDRSGSEMSHDNFQCPVCKNGFMSKHDLMEHKKKHNTKRSLLVAVQAQPQMLGPNPCTVCPNRVFTSPHQQPHQTKKH